MKVIKTGKKPLRSVTLRISEEVMEKIDKIAEKEEVSRQKLIEEILDQVTSDKSFVLNIHD